MFMKKVVALIGNVILYFAIALCIGFIFDRIWGLDTSVWIYACMLTIGWGIWQMIKLGVKKFHSKK